MDGWTFQVFLFLLLSNFKRVKFVNRTSGLLHSKKNNKKQVRPICLWGPPRRNVNTWCVLNLFNEAFSFNKDVEAFPSCQYDPYKRYRGWIAVQLLHLTDKVILFWKPPQVLCLTRWLRHFSSVSRYPHNVVISVKAACCHQPILKAHSKHS